MITRYTALLCLSLILSNNLSAQIFTQVIDEQELQFKVKQIDEFFRRFNYETDYQGNVTVPPSDTIVVDSVQKRKNLMTLLNLEVFKNDKNELDSISSEFLDYVIRHNKTIHYEDTTWYAEATSSTMYRGKSYPIILRLQTERVKDVIYKWVITDVQSPIFDSVTNPENDSISILPGAHGTAFMTLPDFVNSNAKSVRSLYHKNYHTSSLPVFEFLISTKQIKLSPVTKVTYHFCLEDYNFSVERIIRQNSYNQGWLINNIERKNQYQ